MQKLNWRYDKKGKEWYTSESVAYANDGWSIKKSDPDTRIPGERDYTLYANHRILGRFYKLSTAKTVANLLHFGK